MSGRRKDEQAMMARRYDGSLKIFAMVLWLFLLLSAPALLYAAGEQETVALNFLRFLGSEKKVLSEEILERNAVDPAAAPVRVAHLFHLEGGGYLLVSTDRSISPVKAYSLTDDFAVLPDPYRKALLDELELRVRVVGLPVADRVLQSEQISEAAARWDFLLRLDVRRQPLAVVNPLITAHWDQPWPYNKFLPEIDGKNVLVGCVNVALGQIMRHHRHPASGQGVFSYDWNDYSANPPTLIARLKSIFYHSYNWGNMPDRLDQATPEYQADEVALLLRDLGVANSTSFGLNDSAASFSPDNLLKHFGYSTALAKIDNTNYETFKSALKNDIDAGRPLLLAFSTTVKLDDYLTPSGGGHMVAADGYSDDDTGLKAHLNMGWGGRVDDFYFLDQPVPAGAEEYGFDTRAGELTLYCNIKPCTPGNDCFVNLEADDTPTDLKMEGDFDGEKDEDIYAFYLKGATSFSATRGYSNVGFYVSFVNLLDGKTVFALTDPNEENSASKTYAVGDLPEGKYQVRVSLCNDRQCYSPADGFNAYNVTLTTQAMTTEEVGAVDALLERAPVIENPELPDMILNTVSPETKRILIDARDENGDALALSVDNSNPLAVSAVLKENILELTPTEHAKIASRIVVTATANGQSAQRSFIVMTDNSDTSYGRSFVLNGAFADQDDVYLHPVILDGACTIQGNTAGYSGQGFFTSVVGASDDTVVSLETNGVIDQTYTRGLYRLRAALVSEDGTMRYPYYVDDPGHPDTDKFTLSVSCPAADAAPATVAGLLGIDLSGASLLIVKAGDINGDEKVNMADAVLGLQLLTRMDLTGQKINIAADPDKTGKIDSADVIFILQKTAELR